MEFRDIVARHEERLVRGACQSEGFDAELTEAVITRHLGDPSRLDLAERSWDGVAKYVRRLAREIAEAAGS